MSPRQQNPKHAAIATLKRELGIESASIAQLIPLNTEGWAVNSSFSNQKLYGFVAHIENTAKLSPEMTVTTYPHSLADIQQLLQKLTCLQCRAVFLKW
jgi:hypothetical protein